MILLSASGGVIHLIDAFQGTQLHTFTVSKVKKAIIGFLAFIRIITMLTIFEINHVWTAEMKWNENEEMIVAVNTIYAIA